MPRFVDWIWHVRGAVPLAPDQSDEEAFGKLDSLFHATGTTHARSGHTLTFRKKDPAAQDKMSVFDSGELRIERCAAGRVLRYHLVSRALLLCFLAPFLFLAVAQLTIAIATFEAPSPQEKAKAEAKAEAAKRRLARIPMNPIDRALGAPAPEKPKKDKKKEHDDKKPSAAPAYVFAAIFAVLYVVGRLLEDWLMRRLFRRRLHGSAA